MVRRCINCGKETDLSKSDIIPDALTNGKIINPNVCRIAHNNKFSDMFEDEVISKLAFITNELDIKSSKGNQYARYVANVIVDGTEYTTRMNADTDLFNKKIMRSADGKSLIGPMDKIKKMKGVEQDKITETDINQIEIEKRVSIDMGVFFCKEMHRLAAKIAFEWYCLNNNVISKLNSFESIIEFIITGEGVDPVHIIGNEDIYGLINQMSDLGSHSLLSYVAGDGSVNILVSLFGIAIYNVRVCDNIIQECPYNALFLTINLDAGRIGFKYTSKDTLEKELKNGFQKIGLFNGLQVMCPTNFNDSSMTCKMIYFLSGVYNSDLLFDNENKEKLIVTIKKHLNRTLNISALTIRGLKRFVNEHKDNIEKGIVFNPYGTNMKAIFIFYLIFATGIVENQIHSFEDLNEFVCTRFSGKKIAISKEVCDTLQKEMMESEHYADIIKKGAKIIETMEFN